MVDFTNMGVLGSPEEFRRKIRAPILKGREPDATKKQRDKMLQKQNEMSSIVNEFILRRVNTLNAQHLPAKLVQVVCCKMTDMQQNIYNHLIGSKAIQQVTDGKQVRFACIFLTNRSNVHLSSLGRTPPAAGQLPLLHPNAYEALQPSPPRRKRGRGRQDNRQECGQG
jgi:SNF2 family DNA or RNA helicase